MKTRIVPRLIAVIALGSGIVNLLSVARAWAPGHNALLREIFPLEFFRYSRFVALLLGFALVVSSFNILRRKRRAFQVVLGMAFLSALANLARGLDFKEAALSLVLAAALILGRKHFTVKSVRPDFRTSLIRAGLGVLIALAYGVAGFWLLDKRHFGLDFSLAASIRSTFEVLTFSAQTGLRPLTRFGVWFLDSLDLMMVAAMVYVPIVLFRPVYFAFRLHPGEMEEAERIVAAHGRDSMDCFKAAPDKTFLFSGSRRAFLAYGVARGFALALSDPVGPEEEIGPLIGLYRDMAAGNGWRCGFHQARADHLAEYARQGFKKLKIGDDAIVDLSAFGLEGKRMKHLRHELNQLKGAGHVAHYAEPPLADELLERIKAVSDDWLRIPGRRERGFTQGTFRVPDVRKTPVFYIEDSESRVEAFVNIVPSYYPGETTIDLMRHRADAPDGVMDFLFIRLFDRQREAGFSRFCLGMAPMSGFREREESTLEERAIHEFLRRQDFLFSYSGLFQYKKKFATAWEPRYAVYRNILDLPAMALALNRLATADHGRTVED